MMNMINIFTTPREAPLADSAMPSTPVNKSARGLQLPGAPHSTLLAVYQSRHPNTGGLHVAVYT